MTKKGKKKHRAQEAGASTSTPSTSEQPSSQQQQSSQQSAQQQQSSKQQPSSQQQQSFPQLVQPPQPRAWGPPRPQLSSTQQDSQQARQPRTWGPPRPQLSSTQQASQQAPQPRAWGPPRPQLSSTQQAPQQAPQPRMLSQQQTPSLQISQQQAWGPRSQKPIQEVPQQMHGPQQVPQQLLWGPRSQQQILQPSAWGPPPQQYVQQQHVQQPVWTSQPSTSSQQVSGVCQQPERGDASTRGRVASPTSKLSEKVSQVSVSESKYKVKSEKDLDIPRRRDPRKAGTIGKRIRVSTNMFEILFHKNFVNEAVHYDVKVVGERRGAKSENGKDKKLEVKNKTLLRQIFEACRRLHFPDRYPAYDGMANAFAARDLPFEDTFFSEVEIFDKEREENRTFEVSMSKAGNIDLSWLKSVRPGIDEAVMNQTSIQVLDVILRHAPASRLISVGRSLFPPGEHKRAIALGKGLDLHVGGFTSAVIGWKPYLNVDVVHKAFVTPQTIIQLICELCQIEERNLNERTVKEKEREICKLLNGLKINYAIPGQPSTKRTFRVNGLGPNSINHKFDAKGKLCSTQEYFADCKNYRINWPELPCLWVGKRDGKTYLPLELCQISPGQVINRKLDESQTTQMIRYAATGTEERKDKIMKSFNGINVNNSPVIHNEFLICVDTKMKEVEARILPPPALQYNDQVPTTVSKGVWRAKRFSTPATLDDATWTIVNICPQSIENKLPDFVQELKSQASRFGMVIGKPKLPFLKVRSHPNDIEKLFIEQKSLKLLIVVLPNHTDPVYGKVKKISELKVGVLTQCIKMKNVIYPNSSTIQNILLKINSKLNGINHTFAQTGMPECLRNTHYMLIGADVSHPSPDAKDIPSVAAVAASHDETTFKYNVTIRLQQAKQEEIADLKEIMLKHIAFYVKEVKKLPKKIIFYRDGVSEGQIAMVLDKEIRSIKEACRDYARTKPEFKPELTFVIVQKRHHIRLFPTRRQDSDDKKFNVKAGTIVDTDITHPNHIDFYLVSHASIQGTARPTKYRCICNESGFNEDQLEELTYHLCHMYARCTRSVSYPAPTYYAHLAAYRGRMWIQGDHYTDMDFQDKNKCKLESKLLCPMSFI